MELLGQDVSKVHGDYFGSVVERYNKRFMERMLRNGDYWGGDYEDYDAELSLRNRVEYLADLAGPSGIGNATGASEQPFVNRIPLDKPIWGLLLQVQYRYATGATTAPGNVLAEGAQNFLQRVRVVGNHKKYGTRELVNLRGATLFALESKYSFGQSPWLQTPGTGSGTALPAPGTAPAVSTSYDVIFQCLVPFVPRGVPKLQQLPFLVRNDEWATFDLFVTFGDASSIVVVGSATAPTFTNFGSASGVPTVRISMIRTILGEGRSLFQPAILRRQFLPLTTVLTAASLTDSAIQDLDVGFKVVSYTVKCGTQSVTGIGAGVVGFTTPLLDTAITRPKIKLDNVTLKDAISPQQARQYAGSEFGNSSINTGTWLTSTPVFGAGYIPIEFCEGHDINTVFRGDMLNRSNKLQLAGDVTAASNQLGEVVEELLEGEPQIFRAAPAAQRR
jgi:hypothetical protein